MHIRLATSDDLPAVVALYDRISAAMEGDPHSARWRPGIYPAEDDLRSLSDAGELWLGCQNDSLVAAYALNHDLGDYASFAWPNAIPAQDVLVIHLLGVDPSCRSLGLAKHLVEHAIEHARTAHASVIRLDVIAQNLPAIRLYESFGFCQVGFVSTSYEGIGQLDFALYELAL